MATKVVTFDEHSQLLLFVPGLNGYNETDLRNSVHENSRSNLVVRVSQAHLKSASAVFKDLLYDPGRYRFDMNLQTEQLVLENDDPTAMTMAMHIIHHQMYNLPERVDFATLHSFAMIVAKYQLLGAIRWIPEQWWQPLRNSWKTDDVGQSYRWMWISGVFRLEGVFSAAANNVVGNSQGMDQGRPWLTRKLPFPKKLNDRLQEVRTELMHEFIAKLYNQAKHFEVSCNKACNELVIGGLTMLWRELKEINVHLEPHNRRSYLDVKNGLLAIHSLCSPPRSAKPPCQNQDALNKLKTSFPRNVLDKFKLRDFL